MASTEGYINGGSELKACDTAQVQAASPLGELRHRKQRLESQLASVNDAIGALEANPEVEKILTLLAKARY